MCYASIAPHIKKPPTDEARVAECFQAGATWEGEKLTPIVVLPSGRTLSLLGPKNEYARAFLSGWETRKQPKKGDISELRSQCRS